MAEGHVEQSLLLPEDGARPDPHDVIPGEQERCVTLNGEAARLTARGVRHADVIGNFFYSERVRRLIDTYEYDA